MKIFRSFHLISYRFLAMAAILAAGCQPVVASGLLQETAFPQSNTADANSVLPPPVETAQPSPTPWYDERPRYAPGELVDYVAQAGDTLPFLAARFNTTVEEILEANSFIPPSATTMPPGMPMKIPIYYMPLWGSPYRILPDSHLVNGPVQVGFNVKEFVAQTNGWLSQYSNYVADANRSGAEIVEYVAHYYSVSPRLLLALLEYQSGALSQSSVDREIIDFPLGNRYWSHKGLFLQLIWAANFLNNSYYNYKNLAYGSIEHRDGRLERFDPWQNSASASLMIYFNTLMDYPEYMAAISPEGLAHTYQIAVWRSMGKRAASHSWQPGAAGLHPAFSTRGCMGPNRRSAYWLGYWGTSGCSRFCAAVQNIGMRIQRSLGNSGHQRSHRALHHRRSYARYGWRRR